MNDTVHVMVTVLDTATIFEGPDTIYRYDLPGTGVREGWALDGVIDQIRESVGPHWPDIEVTIDADADTASPLTETLRQQGIVARWARGDSLPGDDSEPFFGPDEGEPFAEDHDDMPWEDEPFEDDTELDPIRGRERGRVPRGKQGRRHRRSPVGSDRPRWKNPPVLVAACVLPLFLGLSWWGFHSAFPSADAGTAELPPTASAGGNGEVTTGPPSSSNNEEQAPLPLKHGEVEVTLPYGFRIAEEQGTLRAEGADPDLRILLAIDPVHGVPAAEVRKEIVRMIESNETLTLSGDDPAGSVTYAESPGDESRVEWTTWIEDGAQHSVGCHSRLGQFSVPQRAACRMAIDSLHWSGNPTPSKPV